MPSSIDAWKPFASIVLRAAYEATLAVATIHSLRHGERVKCYLTLLGGGEFGNNRQWICDAINLALTKFSKYPLDVRLVHHGTTIDTNWTDVLLERQDTRVLTLPAALPRPSAAAIEATAKAAETKAAIEAAAKAKLDPKGTTKALEPIVPLNINRIPTTLLLLGTSLVRSLLSIQATSKIVPKELKVSDLIEFNSNFSNLPSLKNKETKNKLGDIDKIIDTNINKSDDLQVQLAKYNIGITGNSIYLDTQKSSKELSIVKEEDLFKLLAKINKLPIFQNPEEVKKILLKIDREDSSNVKKMLKEYFNIAISESRVSIDLT
jgi:hypothetical protein